MIKRPPSRQGKVEGELQKLEFAPFTKDKFNSQEELEKHNYLGVMRELDGVTDPNALNNLGCAFAWLAVRQSNTSYWGRSIESFDESIRKAPNDARAKENLSIVRRASGLG